MPTSKRSRDGAPSRGTKSRAGRALPPGSPAPGGSAPGADGPRVRALPGRQAGDAGEEGQASPSRAAYDSRSDQLIAAQAGWGPTFRFGLLRLIDKWPAVAGGTAAAVAGMEQFLGFAQRTSDLVQTIM